MKKSIITIATIASLLVIGLTSAKAQQTPKRFITVQSGHKIVRLDSATVQYIIHQCKSVNVQNEITKLAVLKPNVQTVIKNNDIADVILAFFDGKNYFQQTVAANKNR